MNPSLIIVAYSLGFLLLLSFCLFSYIVARRIVMDYKRRLSDGLYQAIEKDVLEAIAASSSEPARLVALKYKFHPSVLTSVLLNYGQVLSGAARDRLKIIFDLALKDKCLKNLSSFWTIRRLKGARLFFAFFDPAESSLLFKVLRDKPIVRLTTIITLFRVSDPVTLEFIFRVFEHDSGHAVRAYYNIMLGLGEKIAPYVQKYMKRNLPLEKIGLLIELIGAVPLRSLAQDLHPWAVHPDKEIRIKVARALGRLLVPDSVEILLNLVRDDAWEVQCQAVKSLGYLKSPETIDVLSKSLFSPHWFVRYNGAKALAGMGWEGIRRLKRVAVQTEDRFARDMSLMVLNEMAILEEAG